MSDGYGNRPGRQESTDPGIGTGGAGHPYGPPSPAPPGPVPAPDRVAMAAGVIGSVVVVVVTVLVVVLLLGTGGDGTPRPRALPTDPPTAKATSPLTLPDTIEARAPVAIADLPHSVGRLNETMGRTFDGVRTDVFGGDRTRETVLITVASRRDRVPADYVRDFVPAVTVTEEPVRPGPPGHIRCWSNPETATCLWGDDRDLVYVSDGAGVDHARLVVANVYAGSAR